jgi:hypothetical protein|tara:strand:- start:2878 stop:3177 length:300 start_codon:yes stop_codon:yes gene_type:complete
MTLEKAEDQFAHIRNALANASKIVPQQFKSLVDDLKAEALAEKLVVEHGVQHASSQEIEQEFVSLDAVENDNDDDDFENDENLVDMNATSLEIRDAFGE